MSGSRRRTAEHIRHLLETEGDAVRENTGVFNEGRYEVLEDFDRYEELRTEARSIKEDAIASLPELIDQVQERVAANGGAVYVADDAEDAREYVASVVDDEDGETIVKSKSMTTEEIELNERLEADGTEVWETDLGEFVLQVADEAPSHLVGPAIHKSTDEIAALFNEHFEPDEPLETAQELTAFAREYLGEKIRGADVGVTGANFVVAESGTIALVTNEGNARKTAVTPNTHVAVAGIEKLLPTVEDLGPFLELIAKTATGQDVPQYLSLLTPPSDTPTIDFDSTGANFGGGVETGASGASERDFHLVLLDNGRREMRADDQLRETLYCIRCGACSNSCANFQHVGGHAFGGETYTGGIATGWEAGVEGLEGAKDFNDLCTGCSRCVNACPVKIDIPWINTVVRDRLNREHDGSFDFLVEGLTPDEEDAGLAPAKRVFGNFGTLARLGSATAPLSNWLADLPPVRRGMDRFLGIDRRRELPTFKRRTFRDWYDSRGSRVEDPERRVVLYPDTYTNHVRLERGKATVRVLEALGCEVLVPDVGESGRAPLSQGMIRTAEDRAEATHEALAPHLEAGRDVVAIEPSDLAMFRREYERLLPEPAADAFSASSYDAMEYVYGLCSNGADASGLADGDGEVAYHGHCQATTLGVHTYAEALLADAGYDVTTSNVECCGMAGSFGYKSEYYELSMDVGAELADQFADADLVAASGTSCLEQLDSLLDVDPIHPVRLLDPGPS